MADKKQIPPIYNDLAQRQQMGRLELGEAIALGDSERVRSITDAMIARGSRDIGWEMRQSERAYYEFEEKERQREQFQPVTTHEMLRQQVMEERGPEPLSTEQDIQQRDHEGLTPQQAEIVAELQPAQEQEQRLAQAQHEPEPGLEQQQQLDADGFTPEQAEIIGEIESPQEEQQLDRQADEPELDQPEFEQALADEPQETLSAEQERNEEGLTPEQAELTAELDQEIEPQQADQAQQPDLEHAQGPEESDRSYYGDMKSEHSKADGQEAEQELSPGEGQGGEERIQRFEDLYPSQGQGQSQEPEHGF